MVIRIIILLLMILQNTISVFCINNYEVIELKKIKVGIKENELGYMDPGTPGYPPFVPKWFTITDNNLVYICDTFNKYMKIFDLNFNFQYAISSEKNQLIHSYDHFKVDYKGNIVGFHPYRFLLKVNSDGNTIFKMNINSPSLIGGISGTRNYYLIDDYVFYYDDSKKIYCILPSGIKADDNKTNEILTEILDKNKGVLLNDKELGENLKVFLKNNKLLFSNDKLYISNSYIYNQYFDIIRISIKSKKLNNRFTIDKDNAMISFLGFDAHNNSYWQGIKENTEGTITVFSKYGEVLDYFYIQYLSYPKGVIAPNGDVYSWNNFDKNYITFYKIKNVWDPIDPPEASTKQTVPVVTSLTASSFVDYKNLYHPLKAFDGDIKTVWLEAAKGPGIGESITLELDSEIIIDSITILPGYFDTKWWKSNNRVKSLIMKIGDDITTLQFGDEMKPFKADFKEQKTFKKVEFIIKKVYSSGKDDDTAISEIQFYNKGERIKLDFSKQETEIRKGK